MKLPILNLEKYSKHKQLTKLQEEYEEFMEADSLDEEILEGIDLIQAMMGYLMKMTQNNDNLQKYFEIHNEKLSSRKWETDGHIELKFHYK